MEETQKKYLRVDEVALLLNVSDRSVRRWCEYGKLKYVKVGGVVRIKREALLVFIHEMRIDPLG